MNTNQEKQIIEEEKPLTGAKKLANIAMNVLLYVFIIVCLLLVVASISSKKSGTGAMTIFGHQARVVETQSMEWADDIKIEHLKLEGTDIDSLDKLPLGEVPKNSLVFIEVVPEDPEQAKLWYDNLKVGDVVTFMYGEYGVIAGRQPIITHRITKITPKLSGGYLLELNGDNKGLTEEDKTSPADTATQYIDTSVESVNYVVGKVTSQSKALGNLIYIVKQPVGIICIVIVPCVIIIILEVIKIVSVLGEDKKKKAEEEKQKMEEEKQKQESEIELLKKQLAALQNNVVSEKAETVEYVEKVQAVPLEQSENNATDSSQE